MQRHQFDMAIHAIALNEVGSPPRQHFVRKPVCRPIMLGLRAQMSAWGQKLT
jgi:hypothetical protein